MTVPQQNLWVLFGSGKSVIGDKRSLFEEVPEIKKGPSTHFKKHKTLIIRPRKRHNRWFVNNLLNCQYIMQNWTFDFIG
jgi:hypothetical protein